MKHEWKGSKVNAVQKAKLQHRLEDSKDFIGKEPEKLPTAGKAMQNDHKKSEIKQKNNECIRKKMTTKN